jgi:formamidopyrimidine-DNA glycosylase
VPELPEVETVRAQLEPHVVGRRFDDVEILDPRLTQPLDPAQVAAELRGERPVAVDRRGKYLIFRFESGRVLLIHLRMTGTLLHGQRGSFAVDPYRRAVVNLDDGSDVVYRDIRRFGTWLLLDPSAVPPYLGARLGKEPLGPEFTAAELGRRLSGRRTSLKAALLDQRSVAGLGNIYADEGLWRARLHPLRAASSLSATELRRLHRGIRRALHTGIARQGATLRDYRTPNGETGSMQDEFAVYGREGEPCRRCGAPIEKIRVAGRGTWYCPHCQSLEHGR